MCEKGKEPKGSGYYSVAVGLLFLGGMVASFIIDFEKTTSTVSLMLLRVWLTFVAATLLYWGSNRIKTGSSDWTIGQGTIGMVNGVFASTIAILALMFGGRH